MKTLYAFKTVEDMANGSYIAKASGEDLSFVSNIVDYWGKGGYFVTIHCSNSKHITVRQPETLTIVNKDQPKLFIVRGDYAVEVIIAQSKQQAMAYATYYEDGSEKGYPWSDPFVYTVEEVKGVDLDYDHRPLPCCIASYVE